MTNLLMSQGLLNNRNLNARQRLLARGAELSLELQRCQENELAGCEWLAAQLAECERLLGLLA
jgi:hypothetical protein